MDEDLFYALINELASEYRPNDLRSNDNIDCEAYCKLLEMGAQSFRRLSDFYGNESFSNERYLMVRTHDIPRLISEVMGKKFIFPKSYEGLDEKIEAFTVGWLNGYL
ncbi:MAG: hypothetical protein IH845_04060 [Nanoarchaeota archaeon]|nr:hypothetical protein [Nanoarchaeota archaeon]